MGANNHPTVSIEATDAFEENVRNAVRREAAADEWQVWITRRGEDFRTELTVDAETEDLAVEAAHQAVQTILEAAVGLSYPRRPRISVRRVIE